MCGIAGIINFDLNRSCSEQDLTAMCDVMRHRGPDDYGIYVDNNIGLGHRRLSIIDLSSGHQPMLDAGENYCIVFNGEIYNYQELRKELENKGYSFKTSSDTEVILNLYIDVGEKCVEHLNGIFSFAIYERGSGKVYIARDHMGVKPLYYSILKNSIIFASETKSLFCSGELKPECNLEAVSEYLIFRHVAGSSDLYKSVQRLLPGHYMIIDGSNIETKRYWSPFGRAVNTPLSYAEASDQLEALLRDAIKIQMMSDVPLGTFCSGGVDSSLVTAIASEYTDQAINTFSVGFEDKDYDETVYARMVADKYNTQHHELVLNHQKFASLLPKMIWHNDEPINYPNSVQIYAVSQLAKETVTVVLTGEGADELFGGYPRYQIPLLARRLNAFMPFSGMALGLLYVLTKDHRVMKVKKYLGRNLDDLVLNNAAISQMDDLAEKGINLWNKDFSYRSSVLGNIAAPSDLMNRVSQMDQVTYLLSILNRQDKMSMAASLESRVPFLDYRLVEFANQLPSRLKVKGTNSKKILKDLALKYLPEETINRRKSGFGVPIGKWMNEGSGLSDYVSDLERDTFIEQFIEPSVLKSIINDHRKEKSDNADLLWSLINLSMWNGQMSELGH